MAVRSTEVAPTEALKRHIEEHRAIVAELRQAYPNPSESLGAFLRDRFRRESFIRDDRDLDDDRALWLEDDLNGDGWASR